LLLFASRYLKASVLRPAQLIDYRQQAIMLSQLAGSIHTAGDARSLVDFVVDLFPEQLPPPLISSSLREKVAHAEFAAVSDPRNLLFDRRCGTASGGAVHIQRLEGSRCIRGR
jgi:hypothetical protein